MNCKHDVGIACVISAEVWVGWMWVDGDGFRRGTDRYLFYLYLHGFWWVGEWGISSFLSLVLPLFTQFSALFPCCSANIKSAPRMEDPPTLRVHY